MPDYRTGSWVHPGGGYRTGAAQYTPIGPYSGLALTATVASVSGGSANLSMRQAMSAVSESLSDGVASLGLKMSLSVEIGGSVSWDGTPATWDGAQVTWGAEAQGSVSGGTASLLLNQLTPDPNPIPLEATGAAVSGGSASLSLKMALTGTVAALSGGSATCILVPSPPIAIANIGNLKNTIDRQLTRNFKNWFLFAEDVTLIAGTLPTAVTMTGGVATGVPTTLQLREGLQVRATNQHGQIDSNVFTWLIREPQPSKQSGLSVTGTPGTGI
jgi:hypothetical protein